MTTPDPLANLRRALDADASALTAWVGLPSAEIAGLLAREAFDAVTLDLQHGAMDFDTARLAILQIALAGKPALARIPVGDYALASRLLDAGAAGIIAPMINRAADAARFVEYTKYPPIGSRSWGPATAMLLSGMSPAQYLAGANATTVTLAMIETTEGIAALDDILAVDGIDGVFVGPTDMSMAITHGADLNPLNAATDAALSEIIRKCRDAGKIGGVFVHTSQRAAELAGRGYRFFAIGGDAGLLQSSARDLTRAFAADRAAVKTAP